MSRHVESTLSPGVPTGGDASVMVNRANDRPAEAVTRVIVSYLRRRLLAMRIGAHLESTDPLAAATARSADVVQFFLTDPQGWEDPKPRADADSLTASDVDVYIHAPYRINVATMNNRIRIPSRKLLMSHAAGAAAVGAKGLIVHGGHVGKGEDVAKGFDNWRKTFAYAADNGGFATPVLIENTAGGDNACARKFDALSRLWEAIADYDVGFCLDTCHAFAGGEDLLDIVDRVKAITGRIDLIHANDSRDPFDSGRDRHDNLGKGTIDPESIVAVVRAAGCPVVVETPGGVDGQAADIAYLREHL
jgi:deoxyribonuclease-4